MNYQVSYTQIESTPALAEYIKKKIVSTLEKFASHTDSESWRLNIEVGRLTQHHRKGGVWFAEVTGETSLGFIRVREESNDIHAAIDLVEDELFQKLTRSKDKNLSRHIRAARRVKNMIQMSRFVRFFKRGKNSGEN